MTRTDVSLRVGMTHHFQRFCANLEDIILARMPGQSSLGQLSLTVNSLRHLFFDSLRHLFFNATIRFH